MPGMSSVSEDLVIEHLQKNAGAKFTAKQWSKDFDGVLSYDSVRMVLAQVAADGRIKRERAPKSNSYLYFYEPEKTEEPKMETVFKNGENYNDSTAGKALMSVPYEANRTPVAGDIWRFSNSNGSPDQRWLILTVVDDIALVARVYNTKTYYSKDDITVSISGAPNTAHGLVVVVSTIAVKPLRYAVSYTDSLHSYDFEVVLEQFALKVLGYTPKTVVKEVEKIVKIPLEQNEKIVEIPQKQNEDILELQKVELEYYKNRCSILERIAFGKENA